MQFTIIIERGATSYGAYFLDLPGCVAVGDTREEARELIQEAIEFHLEGFGGRGLSVLDVVSMAELVEISA